MSRIQTLQRGESRTPSRPPSTRPPTRASARPADEPSFVVAITSSQGTGMNIGIAAIDTETLKVYITQIADTHTYARTLRHLTIYKPTVVIAPDTFFAHPSRKGREQAIILTCIMDEFDVICTPVARSHWSADAGLDFIKRLTLEEFVAREQTVSKIATLMAIEDQHFARCATSALFKYLEQKDDMIFAPSSVLIRYVALEGTMFIDHETIANLELVSNKLGQKQHTLLKVVDKTKTPMAKRLLRATILQPSIDPDHINRRLDVVQGKRHGHFPTQANEAEISNSQELYDSLERGLSGLPKIDVEKLTAKLIKKSKNLQGSSALIGHLLELRDVVLALPQLVQAARGSRSPLLRAISKALEDQRCAYIEQVILAALTTETTSRSSGSARKNNILFAIKADYHKLLDVARATYKENVEDIDTYRYGIECGLVSTTAGFFLQTKQSHIKQAQPAMSPDFINVVQHADKLRFTHASILVKANARMKDSEEEILSLSHSIVNKVCDEVVEHIGCLYSVSEAIALADLLWGFASYSIGKHCVRPEFVDTLAFSKARHPILDVTLDSSLIPNDCYAEDGLANFQLIGGPNMAGKTTYLRMIGLLVVQSMLGCFVPAEYVSIRLHDALLSKLGNGDCMQRGLSTFAQEMATMSMILGIATHRSLVLVDELGRGTSPEEGVGIAHALAEAMLKLKAWTFFTTHFRALSTTLASHTGFVNLHLAVQQAAKSADRSITFRFKVREGPCFAQHYGLELAKLAALPKEVMTIALEVAEALGQAEAEAIADSTTSVQAIRSEASLELLAKLEQTVKTSRLSRAELVEYLQILQQECFSKLLKAKTIEDAARNTLTSKPGSSSG